MLKNISRFCSRYPWLILIVALAVTVFMIHQIREKSYFEADMTKFLPKDMQAVKSDDYYKKNFNYQDAMLIGVEKKDGSVTESAVLRKIENIILDLKGLKAAKSFDSKLTGRQVTLVQAVGIDSDSITSIANLEDAVLDKETGSVISGSVIKKLKKEFGIASAPGKEELLPESDVDLVKIVPSLTQRILNDRSFSGNILSADLHASNIRVSMLRKFDYKKRYAALELSTALDAARLKSRFQGKDSLFPFSIYGKTIDGVLVDDEYIENHAQQTRQSLTAWLNGFFRDTYADEPRLQELLSTELTAESFLAVMKYLERNDFFSGESKGTWVDFTNNIWDITLERIDPFSRENLEFQLHNVKEIFDFAEVYNLTLDILQKHALEGVEYHVAGTPVVIGVFSQMMQKDMALLVPIAVLMVLLTLVVSFRSVRGVVIPSATVALAVIWTLGVMAMMKIPFTSTTTVLPVILLAIGTAYGIHLLNRYYEDADTHTDRRQLIQTSVTHVGVAVVMAAITTVAGFSSLATSGLTPIKHFGGFAGVGVVFALILSLTLTPAMLVIWRLPQKKTDSKPGNPGRKEGPILTFMRRWAEYVTRHPKAVFVVLGLVFVASALMMTGNRFEGSMMTTFKEDNPLFLSDRFLNKNLTGTTNINLVFKFRDRINLDNPQAQKELRQRLDRFALTWKRSISGKSGLESAAGPIEELQTQAAQLPRSLDGIIARIQLVQDILDEEFSVETAAEDETDDGDSEADMAQNDSSGLDDSDMDDLGGLAEDDGDDPQESTDSGPFADLSEEQILGLKDIAGRLGTAEKDWEAAGTMVLRLRESKSSPAGLEMQRTLNLIHDFLAVDIKQPAVLHKLNDLYIFLKELKEPVVVIQDQLFQPTGFVMTPVDFVRKFYKVFYHDDNPAFDRLPDVEKDGFTDRTLTDRSIIGVVLNQALSANRDNFEAVITPDLKEFQVQIMIRDGSHVVIGKYLDQTMGEIGRIFPEDDPYIEDVKIGGGAPTGRAINDMISSSQIRSIFLSFLFVFIVTFFIFRSATGGLFSLVPLLFTVVLNFGLIALLGGEITMSTMMVASIAIGTGVDYTIHFLERLKIQLRAGDSLPQAYINTVLTTGKAILLNATAVALGFLVLLFSIFVPQMMMGLLMCATMFFSSLGALTLLPAIILVTRPKFLEKVKMEAIATQNALKN
ncbi:MAG: MMPL family transporter [Proteobacteria bacterium]|nr:MMPL family transporter [Pseudomonadota bacterium]